MGQFPGSREGVKPDFERAGVKVWIDHEEGHDTLFVVIRQDKPKKWHVVSTVFSANGGEVKFETKAKLRNRLDK